MTNLVCEEYCQKCWEEFASCACYGHESDYSEYDYLLDHAELDSEPGELPRDPLLGGEVVKTKKPKCKPQTTF